MKYELYPQASFLSRLWGSGWFVWSLVAILLLGVYYGFYWYIYWLVGRMYP